MILSAKEMLVDNQEDHEIKFDVSGIGHESRGPIMGFKIERVLIPSHIALDFIVTGLWVDRKGDKDGNRRRHLMLGNGELSAVAFSETSFPLAGFEDDVEPLREGDSVVLRFKSTRTNKSRISACILGRVIRLA